MTNTKPYSQITRLVIILVTVFMVTSVMLGGGMVGLALASDDSTTTVSGQDVDTIGASDPTSAATSDGEDSVSQNITATRSIDRTSVSAGSTVNVTTKATFSNETADGAIIESFTPDLDTDQIEITDADDATVAAYSERVGELTAGWGDRESVSVEYEIAIPDNASAGEVYTISGEALDREADAEQSVSGDNTITVVDEEGDITDVTRDVSISSPAPGTTTTVSLDAEFRDGALSPSITDEISPALDAEDITITDDDGATVSEYQEVSGLLTANYDGTVRDGANLQYEITIPEDAETGDTYELALRGTDNTETITVGDEESELAKYADADGVVGPSGLGDAATDFRSGELDPATLGEVAAAFRSGGAVI